MGTLRKTWHLRDEDILYVEENHDGKYGAPGKKRQPKRKLTPEDIYRINHWNKIKRQDFWQWNIFLLVIYGPHTHINQKTVLQIYKQLKNISEMQWGK
ncbi:MAG: hypothetical protein ACLTZM_10660 [Ruminococcus sp.]